MSLCSFDSRKKAWDTNNIIFDSGQQVKSEPSLIVLCGPGTDQMGRDVAKRLELEASAIEHRTFPDGESYIRLPLEVEGRDVVLIHSTAPPQDTRLVQLLLTLDAIRERGAKSVLLVTPYLAYARQDRCRLPGEAVSVLTVAGLLLSLGVSKLITVNVHNPRVFDGSGLDVNDLSAIPLLADYFKGIGFEGAFALSLGKKPVDLEHAREVASVLRGDYGRLETFRDPTTGEVSLGKADLGVEGRGVIVFDDVITSGRTHLEAVRFLREMGAEEVHLACVHSLLPEKGMDRVLKFVDSYVTADTVPSRFSRVGVAQIIAEALRPK
jgi:ribose-phosphate pyrophosphokinase